MTATFAKSQSQVASADRTNQILREVAERFGTPSYVYFLDEIAERSKLLAQVFGGRFEISYAVKANPNRALLREMASCVAGLDVSSGGELRRAIDCGYTPEQLSFSGPGKSHEDLALAVDSGCGKVIVESCEEAAQLDRLAGERCVATAIVLRVSPRNLPKGFGVSMARRPSQFGIDEEVLDDVLMRLSQFKNLRFSGFHIYAGAQCLDVNSIVENFEIYVTIFTEFSERYGLAPEHLFFGSGIGIPYHDGDVPVDLGAVGRRVNPLLDSLRTRPCFRNARLHLEIGRLLVGQAGYFLTQIRRAKLSRGKEIRICDGGLNNHLAACGHFGSIIHRNYVIERLPLSNGCLDNAALVPYDVFGPLCTTIDQLARDLRLPSLDIGDLLVIKNSGAYGYSASPMHFISHPPAREIIVRAINGEMELFDVSDH